MLRPLLILPLTLLLAACNTPGSPGFRPGSVNSGGWPFVPTSMRIYPLTHIERGSPPPAPPANPTGPSPADNVQPQDVTPPPAQVRLIAHLEFRDAWGDTTKAVGSLTILLYGPNSNANAARGSNALPRDGDNPDAFAPETQQRRYDIDLTDLKRNAELYDPATRTYRIPLSGLPDWIINSTPSTNLRITLRAEAKSPRADGSSVLLVDEYVVTK
ncbi:MAG: hypothetical protein JNK16_04560 [Phycisphaerales bacterium]|nr:hypothetical protein [Phycisphaerales bacterium]